MAELDLVIRAFSSQHRLKKDVDARIKSAHDGLGGVSFFVTPDLVRGPVCRVVWLKMDAGSSPA